MSDFEAKMRQNHFLLGIRPRPFNLQICCHQMASFEAKMRRDFGWGAGAPDLAGGACSALPDTLAVFKGPTSKGREGKGSGRGRKGKGERGEEVEARIYPTQKFWCAAPYNDDDADYYYYYYYLRSTLSDISCNYNKTTARIGDVFTRNATGSLNIKRMMAPRCDSKRY